MNKTRISLKNGTTTASKTCYIVMYKQGNGSFFTEFDTIEQAKCSIDEHNKSAKGYFPQSTYIIVRLEWEKVTVDNILLSETETKKTVYIYGNGVDEEIL